MTSTKASLRPAILGLLASLFLLWACHVGTEEAAYLNVKVDTSWTRYDRVMVVLADTAGNPLDTLFDAKLVSVDQLGKLDGKEFDGGKVQVILIGYLKGEVAKRETRPFDGKTGESGDKIIVVLIPLDPDPVDSTVLDIKPDIAKLYTGGPSVTLAPAGAGWNVQALLWSTDFPSIATVEAGMVKPVSPGKTWIKAVSGAKRDSSEVTVATDPPVLTAGADTVVLLDATVTFRIKAEQEFGIFTVFKWSLDGDTLWDDSTTDLPASPATLTAAPRTFPKAGTVTLRFLVRDGEGNVATASREVIVSDPALPVIASIRPGDTTVSIKDSLTFSAQVTSSTDLKSYEWDLDGDGQADASGPLSGNAGLIAAGRSFPDTGSHTLALRVSDANGGTITRKITVIVVRDPPVADAGADTTVAAGTRVNLRGKASDKLGKVAKTEWKIGTGAYVAASPETSFTAPAVGGTSLTCSFRVTDDDGLTHEDAVTVTISASADADLLSLTPSAGTLDPAFARNVQAYTLAVANNVSFVTLTATAANSGATLKVNGSAVAGGQASGNLALSVGPNTLTVEVSAQSGLKKVYTVTATRAGSPVNTLQALIASAGALSPVFAAGTTAYTVTTSLTGTTVTPTVTAGSNATVKVNGTSVASGTASASINLPAGATTTVTVEVTAENGTTRSYTIAFTVAPDGKPDLAFTSATITAKTPTRVDYAYTIVNNGNATVPNLFNVSLQNFYSADTVFNNTGDQAAGGAILAVTKALGPGESHSGTFHSSGAVPAGHPFLTFKIDWGDSVDESDETNNTVSRRVLVPPVADAGADTTVAAGTAIRLHGKASDPIGNVAKTEWKIGGGAYLTASPDTTFAAPAVGGTTFTCSFRVTDDDGLTHEDSMTVTVLASADADLLSLAPSTGSLVPAFARNTQSYTMAVANSVSSMTLTPTAANSAAILKVNGATVVSGQASGSLALAVGSNTLTVEVTAQSGLKKNYVVTVSRAGSAVNTLQALTATAGALTPAFAAGTLAYTVNTTSTTTTVTPTVTSGSGATVKVNGAAVASGSASASVSLPAGFTTTVNIEVTAENGTTRTYSIAFTVPGTTKPDLVILSATITAVSATRYDYTYTIKNEGGSTIASLNNVSIQNFYSADTVFNNTGDQAAGGAILGLNKSLAPGESHSGTFAAYGTPNTGMKFITWKIDWGDSVDESNENNNTTAMPLP